MIFDFMDHDMTGLLERSQKEGRPFTPAQVRAAMHATQNSRGPPACRAGPHPGLAAVCAAAPRRVRCGRRLAGPPNRRSGLFFQHRFGPF